MYYIGELSLSYQKQLLYNTKSEDLSEIMKFCRSTKQWTLEVINSCLITQTKSAMMKGLEDGHRYILMIRNIYKTHYDCMKMPQR